MEQVRTRKHGKTFSYIFEAGKSSDGKRKVVEKGGFVTQKEAYNKGVADLCRIVLKKCKT